MRLFLILGLTLLMVKVVRADCVEQVVQSRMVRCQEEKKAAVNNKDNKKILGDTALAGNTDILSEAEQAEAQLSAIDQEPQALVECECDSVLSGGVFCVGEDKRFEQRIVPRRQCDLGQSLCTLICKGLH